MSRCSSVSCDYSTIAETAVSVLPDDAAVAGGIGEPADRIVAAAFPLRWAATSLQRFGAHQRSIPREHNRQLRAPKARFAICRAWQAVLRLLQDRGGVRLEWFNNSGDLLGLVPDEQRPSLAP